MGVKLINKNETTLIAAIDGEIDHHTAQKTRETIDSYINNNISKTTGICKIKLLILDFGKVKFTDSSGIGLIMGRYKLMKEHGGQVKVINIPEHLIRMIKLGGLIALGIF